MKFGEIVSKSFKFPFGDLKNLAIFCALFLLAIIMYVGETLKNEIVVSIGFIAFLILFLIVPGYSISVTREGCRDSNSMPTLNIKKNIIDTIQLLILNIVFMIIPCLVLFLSLIVAGWISFNVLTSSTSLINGNNLLPVLAIIAVVNLIVFLIFTLMNYVAIARFAGYDSLSEALNLKKVYADIKRIGVLKLLAWFIVFAIIFSIVLTILRLVILIPYAGNIIYICFIVPVFTLIFYYSLGLLYNDISDGEFDLASFERELEEFRIQKYDLK